MEDFEMNDADEEDDFVCEDDINPEHRPRMMRQRSVSLPQTAASNTRMYGPIPSLEDVQEARGGWDRLGLYLKGVPGKIMDDKHKDARQLLAIALLQNSMSVFSQNESLEDLNISASSVMLSLKADQDSFDKRFEIQVSNERYELSNDLMVSCLGEAV